MSFERRPFADRLADAVRRCGNPVVVGLDPRWEQLPNVLNRGLDSPAERAAAFRTFCCEILDVVAHRVPAVKPQLAFFEELGPHGTNALADVIQHARRLGVLVILDGKRNDIGSTAEGYARAYLGESSAWQGDSLTVSPYLGDDSLTPFVKQAKDGLAGIFVLVKTSNPGGRTFQDLIADGKPLYRHVAELVESLAKDTVSSSGYGVAGAVVGATYPEQLAELRETMPHAWFLVPGFGAQGGSATDVKHAFHENGLGAIINSSRGIIFAHELPKYASWAQTSWQTAVDQATTDMVEQLRADTPVGTLPLA